MQGKKGPKRIPQVEGAQRKHCVINSILINPPSRKEYSSRASSVLSPEDDTATKTLLNPGPERKLAVGNLDNQFMGRCIVTP